MEMQHSPSLSLRAIKERLSLRVLHQTSAVEYVATQLSRAVRPPRYAPDEQHLTRPRIMSMIFCGPTGCGKTEMAITIRELMGGSRLPYVYVDASTCKDPTSVTRATGASAGFEGCSDGNSLPEQLADLMVDPEKRRLERLNKSTNEYKQGVEAFNRRIKRDGAFKGPSLIYIFIDEIDKAEKEFIVALNGLLDQGQMTSARGRVFAPSKECTLLFVFTSNYADQELCRLPYQHTETAQRLVREDMQSHGLQNCTIERFGEIVPFYPLQESSLKDILHKKLETYLARGHDISDQFGPLSYEADVKTVLVDRVARMADTEGGIRNGTKLLFKNLDRLFAESFDTLESMMHENPLRLPGSLSVFIRRFNLVELQHKLDGNLARLLNDSSNQMELRVYRERQEESITALGLRAQALGVVALHVMSLPVQINVNVLLHSTVPEVEAENRELRHTLKELAELDDTSDHYQEVKRILATRPHLLTTSNNTNNSLMSDFFLEESVDSNSSGSGEEPPLVGSLVEAMQVEEKSVEPIVLKRKAGEELKPSPVLKLQLKKPRIQTQVVDVQVTAQLPSEGLSPAELFARICQRFPPPTSSSQCSSPPSPILAHLMETSPNIICIDD